MVRPQGDSALACVRTVTGVGGLGPSIVEVRWRAAHRIVCHNRRILGVSPEAHVISGSSRWMLLMTTLMAGPGYPHREETN